MSSFRVLKERVEPAETCMARDALLLSESIQAEPAGALFRHYGWSAPSATFGRSQAYEEARAKTPSEIRALIRRPTGGGLVDHRLDWTWSLALGRSHTLYRAPAAEPYRIFHEAMQAALDILGRQTQLAPCLSERCKRQPRKVAPSCFDRAEPFDLADPSSGNKIAGAAMRRSREGLLAQGSIHRPAVGELDWGRFAGLFADSLARALGLNLSHKPIEEPPQESIRKETELFASSAWNRRR